MIRTRLSDEKRRRRQLGEIRVMVASWKHGHLPYADTLVVCILSLAVLAVLWGDYSYHGRVWAGWLMVLPAVVVAAAVVMRLREPLNWQDLIARRLAVYPYRDVTAWRELQQVVVEAGFISVPMLTCWLDKEMQTFTTPARRRTFAFTERERDERGESDCRSHHE
ncbi:MULTISPECIES: hypothetical protein [unclassified Pantoea]|uniref:hypothetical protein n=1 Tax=unclassified Pantoea TaxID=2630326 RepID=UPI0012322DCA|nr:MULTISPECIES: hypothetical protein [unclassified Pantoea]KAA6094159.1 hypothetical protein F3I21_22100 [Pantoea sp. B_9]KAA6107023.1 hypothetical protein F3I18_22995 [Pantoea sp. B_10]